ncbi:hypothetical protein QCA50_008183 [Cerrena zonata]|uniref:Uncharacterized protein n=1 Tax=Cerrena zonata TaxID=2478898 RepID=A0AAW0GI67_9APHY
MIVDDTSALPPVVDAVCDSSSSPDLESQTSPRPSSLAEVSPLPIEAESVPSSSEPHHMPPNAPEELTSQPNVEIPGSPLPFPSSNILPNPDLHTSVPECVDVSEEPSSTTVPTPIPMASDISDEFVTINLTTPEGNHVPLEVPKDDDGLSDSETVVHSPVLSPKNDSEGSVLKPKEDSLLPLFDRDWRIFDEFVMI